LRPEVQGGRVRKKGGREGGREKGRERGRERGTEGGREGGRDLVGGPTLVGAEHNDVGSLVVEGVWGGDRPLPQKLHVGATALQGLLHLHLVLEDQGLEGR
jgi:predicted transposase YdaD